MYNAQDLTYNYMHHLSTVYYVRDTHFNCTKTAKHFSKLKTKTKLIVFFVNLLVSECFI